MKSSPSSNERSFPETAEEWLARLLAADCNEEDRAAFEFWLSVDSGNASAFAEVDLLHRSAARLSNDPLIQAASRTAKRQTAYTAKRKRALWALRAVSAAAVLTIVVLSTYRLSATLETRYTSDTSLRTIQLTDGTRMRLDADSAVTVRFDHYHRVVQLEDGRAEFEVAVDSYRPFEVHVGGTVIRDIGTTFQVSRNKQGLSIGLLEGRVEISGKHSGLPWTQKLLPSQQLHISADGRVEPITALDTNAAKSWPLGQLVFHQRRLDDVLFEANRYSSIKLRLGDPSLASLLISGSFHAGDQWILAQALQQGWKIKFKSTAPDEIILQRQ